MPVTLWFLSCEFPIQPKLHVSLAKDFFSFSQLSYKHAIAWRGETAQSKDQKLGPLPSSAAYWVEWPLPFRGPCLPPSLQQTSHLLPQELGEWQKSAVPVTGSQTGTTLMRLERKFWNTTEKYIGTHVQKCWAIQNRNILKGLSLLRRKGKIWPLVSVCKGLDSSHFYKADISIWARQPRLQL